MGVEFYLQCVYLSGYTTREKLVETVYGLHHDEWNPETKRWERVHTWKSVDEFRVAYAKLLPALPADAQLHGKTFVVDMKV